MARAKIEAALKRSVEVDARRIHVARQAAWSAPGVKEVDDRIAIVP
jgi:osmotically-inducible protein OsmY